MVSSYKILEHPADIGLTASGSSLKEAIEAVSTGLCSIMMNTENIDSSITKKIELEAIDTEALIIKWLNEILFYFDSEAFICKEITVNKIICSADMFRISGFFHGETFSTEKHKLKVQVKAVTYHQFEVVESPGSAQIKVFFDI